ncbi:hypothetical protein [Asticcacaulis sp. AND118]|uniref:hypothetical protein n=1 Tax=Asticcacaulis sp. AND118 TaxID=2840468 RepID=UPI001CFF8D1F|nr:hypothetical protein [Asticcacaulis sp. AND118]UDF04503.1 hypothetical protein LH365_05560 [Asticcacaulis sp. AND118]
MRSLLDTAPWLLGYAFTFGGFAFLFWFALHRRRKWVAFALSAFFNLANVLVWHVMTLDCILARQISAGLMILAGLLILVLRWLMPERPSWRRLG